MNRFRSLCLVVCSLLLCLSGFSPVVSYAYGNDNALLYFNGDVYAYFRNSVDWGETYIGKYLTSLDDETKLYSINNTALDDVHIFTLSDSDLEIDYNFMYDLYDYYFYVTVFAEISGGAGNVNDFSFCPQSIMLHERNCDLGWKSHYMTDVTVYHHDNSAQIGHSLIAKFPENICNTSIYGIDFIDSNGGTVPADLKMKGYIIEVDKGTDTAALLGDIKEQLSNINTAINEQGQTIESAINQGMDKLQRTIEEQYSVSEEEDFGVNDIVNQVEQKAGVLAVGTTTLVNFLDLFDSSNAGSTQLTFPGFSMEIQGTSYQIWNDFHYDLSELDTYFGGLMEVVRWATTMVVYLAVLNYLVRAFDEIFGSK